jgi:hypothetical protein
MSSHPCPSLPVPIEISGFFVVAKVPQLENVTVGGKKMSGDERKNVKHNWVIHPLKRRLLAEDFVRIQRADVIVHTPVTSEGQSRPA